MTERLLPFDEIDLFMADTEESEGTTCDITGCTNAAERSLPAAKVKKTSLKFDSSLRRVKLCREHYKIYKKETKLDRTLEKLGR